MEMIFPKNDDLHFQTVEYRPLFLENGSLDIADMLMQFQNACSLQIEKLNIGEEFKRINSVFYVLCRLKGYFLHKIQPGKSYTLVTYPMQASTLQMYRYMYLLDEEKKPVFYLITLWVLIDQNTRRLKPTKVFQNKLRESLPDIDEVTPISDERLVVIDYSEEELKEALHYQVSEDDLDTNGHMNNTKYMKVAQMVEKRDDFKSFEINFEKECFLTEKLTVYKKEEQSSSIIIGKKENETLSFVVKFTY